MRLIGRDGDGHEVAADDDEVSAAYNFHSNTGRSE
jgi:hypothetical protein